MSSDTMIHVQGMGKAYLTSGSSWSQLMAQLMPAKKRDQFWALQPLDLDIQRGEVVGIIGHNGSGKSTLLQMICGTLTPTCGKVEIKGRLAALLELGAGFNMEFTGWENIRLNAALYGLSQREIESKLPAIEAFADIGEFIGKPVKTYSSGMFVRLAFAVIANIDADILVIDEALAVGDVFFTQKCMRFLKSFAERGTILFVSHDSTSVVSLCTRALLLDRGRMLAVGDPKTITEYYLKRQYDKRQGKAESAGNVPASIGDVGSASNADVTASGFGLGGVVIDAVTLENAAGLPVLQLHGATKVRLGVQISAKAALMQPLAGFSVKDRLGQVLFGGNTEHAGIGLQPLQPGQSLKITFEFTMPGLTLGDYMISVAAGEGTAHEHVMHHWIHDACAFRSVLPVQSGILEVALDRVRYDLLG